MDKDHKLQRYSHKDYSELVDFPVEIVGRDGVIRRYTFEDAIRLYQRRITFAPIRYRDRELIDAEIHHCRHRIDQLRRSFFYRYGWGTPADQPHPEDVFGGLAGELAAFVRRVLRVEGRPDVRLEPIEQGSGGVSAWLVVPGQSEVGMLLYVHSFEVDDREAARERFFTTLKALEVDRADGAGEQLLAFHHTADCGFLLTGQTGQFESIVGPTEADGVIRDITPTLWDRLIDQVRLGQYQDALATSRRLVREQPMHRRGYVVGACLSSFLGQPQTSEEMAVLGTLYFPHDATLQYWRGLASWRKGDLADAATALQATLDVTPHDPLARFLMFVVRFEQSRWVEAARLLRAVPGSRGSHGTSVEVETSTASGRRAVRVLDAMRRAARMFFVAVLSGVVLSVSGLVLWPFLHALALIPVGLGALFGLLAVLAFRHELDRLLSRQRFDDVPSWVRRVVRETPSDEALL